MRRFTNVGLASLGLLLGTAGCNGFLTGDKLSTDPNLPSVASAAQLLVAVQAAQFAYQEGTVPMMMCMWVQSCAATNGRFVEQAGRYVYGAGSNIGANPGDWSLIYDGGGLIDIHQIEKDVRPAGDSTFLAIAKIWEAFTVGSAADMWGSIPYTQIATSATPDTDSQFAVYDSVQSLLSQAIAELQNGAGAGPGAGDFIFGGNRPSWIAAANTLKARYYLHTVQAAGAGKLPGGFTAAQQYNKAIAAALAGIGDPTGAHDFRALHNASTSQRNMWAQFQTSSGFGGDLEAGKPLTDLMLARNDPRLPLYFCQNTTVAWKPSTIYHHGSAIQDSLGHVEIVTAPTDTAGHSSGATTPVWAPAKGATTTDGALTWTNFGIPYGGDDFNTTQPAALVSNFNCQPLRFSDTFSVPYVTYSENELILAEAYNQTGNDALALTHLNNERAVPGSASGMPTLTALPALVGITGAALYDSIMTEKKIALFQNIETVMDYRRTCLPAVTPVIPNVLNLTKVPGELFYPPQERRANAANIPTESQEIATGLRTEANVSACP
jgi:SusD/RagB-like outer membrane lipoprotein